MFSQTNPYGNFSNLIICMYKYEKKRFITKKIYINISVDVYSVYSYV